MVFKTTNLTVNQFFTVLKNKTTVARDYGECPEYMPMWTIVQHEQNYKYCWGRYSLPPRMSRLELAYCKHGWRSVYIT